MSNNFISKGSSRQKIDLHIHTPASYDWDSRCSETAKDIVNKAIAENLSIIAITDHHTVKGIDEIVKTANGKNITVLPGVELRTDKGNKKIHIIGVFDVSITSKTIYDKLLCPLDFSENDIKTKGDKYVYCNFEKACQKIHELGGLILLHAGNKSNGIEQLDSDIRATLKSDLALLVDIFEVSGQKQVDDYREIVFTKIKKEFPCVITSDACDRSKLRYKNGHSTEVIGKKYSWIKSETTFQGLKEILYEPILRVSLDDQCPVYLHPQRTFIEIETPKEYLNQQRAIKDRFYLAEIDKILFNPNLNSLIGGRATGKSTLLELLGFVFDKYQKSENSKKPSITENLQSKYSKIKIKIGFKYGEKEYQAEKVLSDVKSDLFGFDIIYLPQDEIEKRASDDEAITDLINNLIDESKLKADKSILINNRLTLEKYRNNYSQKFTKEKELMEAQKELKKIQLVLNFAQSDRYKSLVAGFSLKIKEREKVDNAISGIEWQVAVLTRTKQELEENLDSDIASLSGYMANSGSYTVEKTKQKIIVAIQSLEEALAEVKRSAKYKKLLTNIDNLQKKYIQACKQLGLDLINQNKIKDALDNKGKVEIKIRQLDQVIKLINSIKSKHSAELKSFETAYKNHQSLEKTLTDNAKVKFGTDLEIAVAVQCKLARIMFALLKYKKYYDPLAVAQNTFEQAAA